MTRISLTTLTLAMAATLWFAGSAMGGTVATDGDVPSDMDTGGTSGDPALYVLDNYTPDPAWTTFRVGQTTSYNELHILNGSVVDYAVNNQWWVGKAIGASATATNNRLLVSGAGSSLSFTGSGSALYVGYEGDDNSMVIENGAAFSSAFYMYVGANSDGSGNSLAIDAATADLSRLYIGDDGSNNSVVASNGGSITSGTIYMGQGGTGNSMTVGSGAVVNTSTGYGAGSIGSATFGDNTLTVEDGALYKLDTLRNNSSTLISFGTAAGNYLRLAAGFVAISGNRVGTTSDLDDPNMQVWDGAAWQAAVRDTNYTATYYSDSVDALAATGIDGLGGYTIYTGGVGTAPSVLLGDANNDGVVSADDFAAVQTNFGSTGAADGLLPGDANDDGVVSADDFAAIQTNFGSVLGAAAETAPVPEPATLALLTLGGLAIIRRKR